MYTTEIKIRVRYGETDRMGYAYYGNYAEYFEVARVEALRNLGFSYRKLEDEGIMLPVLLYSVKFMKPAYYDDELTIKVSIKELPAARIVHRSRNILETACWDEDCYFDQVLRQGEERSDAGQPEQARQHMAHSSMHMIQIRVCSIQVNPLFGKEEGNFSGSRAPG